MTLDRLEEQKLAMLSGLRAWSVEDLATKPAGGGWSALEVLDHLVRVEHEIINATRHGMATPRPIGMRDRLGFRLVEWVFLSERRVKVPGSVPQVMPSSALDAEEIQARWAQVRIDLASLVVACRAEGVSGGVFRHPVSGWMTLDQVLRFFSAHIVHHGFQVQRIRAALARAT